MSSANAPAGGQGAAPGPTGEGAVAVAVAVAGEGQRPAGGPAQLATPKNFPVGPSARRELRRALAASADPAQTVTGYQKTRSLHVMLSRGLGTTPRSTGPGGSKDGGDCGNSADCPSEEPFDPTPALQFLRHLNPNLRLSTIHSRIASALLTALEDEIGRTPLADTRCQAALLSLLGSAWRYVAVPELMPVVAALVRRLGEGTPREVLVRLAERDAASEGGGQEKAKAVLKHATLLQQFAPKMKRLVYEADWEASRVAGGGGDSDEGSPSILADLVWPAVEDYRSDARLMRAADLAFVPTVRERRLNTVGRRVVPLAPSSSAAAATATATGTATASGPGNPKARAGGLAAITGVGAGKASSGAKAAAEPKVAGAPGSGGGPPPSPPPSSAHAVAALRDIVGDRPKLLGALMNMLIAEHGRLPPAATAVAAAAVPTSATGGTVLGGSAYLHCSLAADVLLAHKQLPRQYELVGILARNLDGCVRSGVLTDGAVAQIQGCLMVIFQQRDSQGEGAAFVSDDAAAAAAKRRAEAAEAAKRTKITITKAQRDDSDYHHKLLRRILVAAIRATKESDPRGLFLNPVTDDIAPGYSAVIKEPMCIRTIEDKCEEMAYNHLSEYERDTKLMFSNCIRYNVGPEGSWFRGEARRQEKLWRDEILTQARDLYRKETAKRRKQLERADQQDEEKRKQRADNPADLKRRAAEISRALKDAAGSTDDNAITRMTAEDVNPLPSSQAKRRKKDADHPSMPCIAAMLLSDPFVSRIILDRVLRSLRNEVLSGKGVPATHRIVPSLLQLLYIVQFSPQLCAGGGRRFFLLDAGLAQAATESLDPAAAAAAAVPFSSLRRYLPLLTGLLLHSDLDRRVAPGGDLHDAAVLALPSRPPTDLGAWDGSQVSCALRALAEGALVHLVQPGQLVEAALPLQLPRFAAALRGLSGATDAGTGGKLGFDRPFFVSLSQALLRHKRHLPHGTRDLVMAEWVGWIGRGDMCAPIHECFVSLMNEWTSFGNVVLPRDKMLSLAEQAIGAAEGGNGSNDFAASWKRGDGDFSRIRAQYERMLKHVPEANASQWKKKMGIDQVSLAAMALPEEGREANGKGEAKGKERKERKAGESMDIDDT